MTVRRLGERGIIARIAERVTAAGHTARLERGIGDDAAVASFRGDPHLVFTSDLLIDGVHFRSEWMPPRYLGHKALAASLSDLAAMGATPELFLLDLGLPPDWPAGHVDALADGLAGLAARHGILLAGGDTVASPHLHVGVTAVGRVEPGADIGRDGGRPGDRLALSGPVGAPAAGLLLLEAGWRHEPDGTRPPSGAPAAAIPAPAARAVIEAHLAPEPEVEVGHRLVGEARAAIDLSDGLARDLHQLCAASACGARIEANRIPVDPAAQTVFEALGRDPVRAALRGGEDYRLLVALPDRGAGEPLPLPGLHPVGRLAERHQGVVLVGSDGEEPLAPDGFEHFPAS